jgi:uncharacterized protein YjiS (DUF1127 family)
MDPLLDVELRRSARLMTLSAAWGAVVAGGAGIAAWYRRRRRIERNIAELSALSDHLLKDIGIHRSEIASVVRSGRDTAQDRL